MFDNKSDKYQSTVTTRFYPGRISDERIKQLIGLQIDIDDLTTDDIVFNIARARTMDLYIMTDVVRQRWGEQAAKEFAEEWARRRAKMSLENWLKRHGVKHGNPELFAKYQDYAHALGGPAHATCFSYYDDEKVVVRKTKCAYHDYGPEGHPSFCALCTEGHIRGYKEADPAIVRSEKTTCLAYGDNYCERTFYFRKMT